MRATIPLIVAIMLVGCAQPGTDSAEDPDESASDALSTGGLRGVVVDPTIRPIEGVVVTIAKDEAELAILTTNADGEWALRGLPPGIITVSLTKSGFLPFTQQTTVVAGEQVPPLLQTILNPAPVDESFIMSLPWEGVVGCAMGANWCAVVDLYTGIKVTNDASGRQFYDEFTEQRRTPDFVQIEVIWEPSSPLGTHMSIELWAGNWEQWETFGAEMSYPHQSYVEPPLMATINATQLADGKVGTETGIGFGLYAGCIPWPTCWPETGPPQAMVNQPFQGFLHAFYGCLPPEGWTFISDGEARCAEN